MNTRSEIDWMLSRYQIEIERLKNSFAIVSQYADKTPEEAQEMFEKMRPVTTYRRNGWLNEDERWAISFYAQKLPRRTSRARCGLHLYEIAAKFACSLPTVYKYANYEGESSIYF